jgi:Uri superfamily endonuclease
MPTTVDPRSDALHVKGVYILHLSIKTKTSAKVGRLGRVVFAAGYYAYVGSAFGPGGLSARLAHHLRRATSPHWHMDFLRPHGVVDKIWWSRAAPASEHLWARALMRLRGARMPVRGFGSSDCRCDSHLIHLRRRPRRAAFRRHLHRLSAEWVPPIRCLWIESPPSK